MTKRSVIEAMPARTRSECEDIARIAKAMGHPARVRILQILLLRRGCVGCDLVAEIGLAASTTSEHLRILKAAGLISGEVERPRVCYSLAIAALAPLAAFVEALSAARSDKGGRDVGL